MIKGFRHRGLERYFTKGTKGGIQAKHETRIRLILARLHASTCPQDMALPGLRLHPLKGKRKGTWAVSVSGNWRITFVFEGTDATDVDYEDYH
ncbi:MAG: type II toxin-antitoxin system RelE/ParE family toxin [Kiritimatiellae bacterium]|nr:type II toxin-antitoxin system RelE/ParE family toxin [Kiritimatiellia bacterium]